MTDLMSRDDRMNRGAVWCVEHSRFECSKRSKRRDGRCHASAIRGTATCRSHAGKRTELAKAQGQAVTAWSAMLEDAGKAQSVVSSAEAVLGMLQMSWLRVHVYAGLLQVQVDNVDGADSGGGGLVGHTFGASPQVGVYATGEAVRALATLEATERERCVKFAKTAHDMKIDDRQIELAEQQGAMLAGAVSRILDALDLSAEQLARVPEIVPRELRAITGGAA